MPKQNSLKHIAGLKETFFLKGVVGVQTLSAPATFFVQAYE
jgi:hypothetical protein